MPKPKILILGAGGPMGILLTRCLKDDFDVYGKDDWHWSRKMIEAKRVRSLEKGFDLIIPAPDVLIKEYVGQPNTFLPDEKEILLCQDKLRCAEALDNLAPETYWIRATTGAGGAGSEMVSEYLPGKNMSCELLYKDGKLHAWFQKERLSYVVKRVEPNVWRGIGSSAVMKCIKNLWILELAKRAIKKISNKPNGAYGIDFRLNDRGIPKITEINAGRFLTGSLVYYYKTGYNLPKMLVELALDLPITPLGKYPEGVGVIRQIDQEPYLGKI